ncbi:peroxiredoxin-like 2C isoform 2-T2 [Thomomys bottae]
MAARIMRQVSGCAATPAPAGSECGQPLADAVAALPVLDAAGERVQFGALFRERRAVVVFVRHFLCYICQEYVEDLAKIPKSFLQASSSRRPHAAPSLHRPAPHSQNPCGPKPAAPGQRRLCRTAPSSQVPLWSVGASGAH